MGIREAVCQDAFNLGLLTLQVGELDAARELLYEALAQSIAIGGDVAVAKQGMALCFGALAGLEAATGSAERAARLAGAAEAYTLPLMRGTPNDDYQRLIELVRALTKEEANATAWAEGAAMTLDQAVDYALERPQTTGA